MLSRTFDLAGVPRPAVVPGRGEPRSGRPVFWIGHEGRLLDGLETEPVDDHLDAVDVLAYASTVAAIAPLSNVADAVERADRTIERIAMMGGEFAEGPPEHNIACDIEAAHAVFRSGIPVRVVGVDQTLRPLVGEDLVDALATGAPFSRLVESELRQFWQFLGESRNNPHDPVAILTLSRPELFTFRRGTVEVVTDGPRRGRTRFTPDPTGPHEVVTDFDVAAIVTEILVRLHRATASSSASTQRS
jgi:purine nucleosidase